MPVFQLLNTTPNPSTQLDFPDALFEVDGYVYDDVLTFLGSINGDSFGQYENSWDADDAVREFLQGIRLKLANMLHSLGADSEDGVI